MAEQHAFCYHCCWLCFFMTKQSKKLCCFCCFTNVFFCSFFGLKEVVIIGRPINLATACKLCFLQETKNLKKLAVAITCSCSFSAAHTLLSSEKVVVVERPTPSATTAGKSSVFPYKKKQKLPVAPVWKRCFLFST